MLRLSIHLRSTAKNNVKDYVLCFACVLKRNGKCFDTFKFKVIKFLYVFTCIHHGLIHLLMRLFISFENLNVDITNYIILMCFSFDWTYFFLWDINCSLYALQLCRLENQQDLTVLLQRFETAATSLSMLFKTITEEWRSMRWHSAQPEHLRCRRLYKAHLVATLIALWERCEGHSGVINCQRIILN